MNDISKALAFCVGYGENKTPQLPLQAIVAEISSDDDLDEDFSEEVLVKSTEGGVENIATPSSIDT